MRLQDASHELTSVLTDSWRWRLDHGFTCAKNTLPLSHIPSPLLYSVCFLKHIVGLGVLQHKNFLAAISPFSQNRLFLVSKEERELPGSAWCLEVS